MDTSQNVSQSLDSWPLAGGGNLGQSVHSMFTLAIKAEHGFWFGL